MKILHRRRLDGWLALTVLASLTARGDLLYHFPFRDAQGIPTLANLGTVGGTGSLQDPGSGSYTNVTVPYLGATTGWNVPDSTGRIGMPDSNSRLRMSTAGETITAMAWVFAPTAYDVQGIFGWIRSDNNRGWGFSIFNHATSGTDRERIEFRLGQESSAIRVLTGSKTVPPDEWVHLAFSWTAGTSDIKIYVNGVSMTVTGSLLDGQFAYERTATIQLGSRLEGGGKPLFGNVTDARIYDEILTQAQIVAIMQTPPGPPKGTVITLR